MEQLIKVQTNSKNEQLVSARDLHQFLVKDANGGQTGQDFTHWIKDKIDFGFEIGVDYTTIGYDYLGNIVEENGVAKNSELDNQLVRVDKRDYILKLDMAKQIAMLQKNDKGKEARQYFVECEKELIRSKQIALPNFQDPAEAAIAWAMEYREKQLALQKVEEQKEIIALNAPKVEFAEQLLMSTDALDFATASKAMSLPFGRNTLFEKLRELKILDSKNEPYQSFVDRGYFTVLESSFINPKTGDRQLTSKTMITASGQEFVLRILRKNNIIN
jgi:anti-repressor protein